MNIKVIKHMFSDENLKHIATHIANTQVIGNLNSLVRNVRPQREISDHINYLQITEWLYFKLRRSDIDLFKLRGLYIWAKPKVIDQEIYQDKALQDLARSLLEDFCILGANL